MMKASVIVLLLVMLLDRGRAQSGCTTALMSLTPCLTYVTGSSATPPPSCCSQLGNVVSSNPLCLCSLLNGGASSLGVSINQTLALALPDKCKVQTPPLSQCNSVVEGPSSGPSPAKGPSSGPVKGPSSVTSPVSSPISDESMPPITKSVSPIPSESATSGPSSATSPVSDEPETPNSLSVPPTPSETISKTVPTTNGSTSGGTMAIGSLSISMLTLIVLSGFASLVIKA